MPLGSRGLNPPRAESQVFPYLFTLPPPGTVATVFDALGRVVLVALADATGTAALALPTGLPAGVYVVRAGTRALRLAVE